jgi:hypothetical protein
MPIWEHDCLSICLEAGWASEPVWTLWGRVRSLPPARNRPPIHQSYLNNSIEHSTFWRAHSRNEVPGILLNPTFLYLPHKSPTMIHILGQINLIHTFHCLLKLPLIYPRLGGPSVLVSYHNFSCTSFTMHATCFARFILFDLIFPIISAHIMQLSLGLRPRRSDG